MLREHVVKGMKVYFGRKHGEKTLGEVVKVNPKKAKVKQLEDRGSIRDYPIGTMWTVPFSLMEPADPTAIPKATLFGSVPVTAPPVPREKLTYNPFSDNNALYDALLNVYVGLSPENLSCDGEASAAHIRSESARLNRQKKGLEIAIGHPVTEDDLYDWENQRREYERAKKAV